MSPGQSGPWGVAVDATDVDWTSSGDGSVKKVPTGGGAPTTLAAGSNNGPELLEPAEPQPEQATLL